ncbi:hypothetical protein ANCDUO_02570 [Ancylostoma duodenale]|uniref:Uncharacterized protein n=1 Tax=Ancylostoma duodenale TaxID=51022 RepID=A0A0C2HC70_9BILA|nr:hypothetical protein ANCDUO_02570 [Ancylostoma duodenale]
MPPRYAAKYGFDKMPNYKHDFVPIPTEHIVIPKPAPEYTVKDLEDVNEADVVTYDVGISRRSRAKYLLRFVSTGNVYTKVVLDSNGKITGLCCIRVVLSNELCIGPFYAENENAARTLLAAALSSIPDIKKHKILGSLYPAINKKTRSLFESIGGGQAKIEPFTQAAFTKKNAAKTLLAAAISSIPDIKKHKILGSLYPAINKEARSLFESIGGGQAKIEPFTQAAFTKKHHCE